MIQKFLDFRLLLTPILNRQKEEGLFERFLICFRMPLGYPHANQQGRYCNDSTVRFGIFMS